MSWYREWRPYVPVATRRARAAAYAKRLAKNQQRALNPIELTGHKIAATFWGRAWCDNLERYSDYSNRLPRGRTYVRNGSVIDLQIKRGRIESIVSGSEIYRVTIDIHTLSKSTWKEIKRDCSQSITSLIDLLQGRFDRGIMQRLTQSEGGLFPKPREIRMACTCPDWATLCKHVAATLYGVGARLDSAPELLFTLRHVDHLELVGEAAETGKLARSLNAGAAAPLADQDLGELFGIELDSAAAAPQPARRSRAAASAQHSAKKHSAQRSAKKAVKKAAAKKPAKKRAKKSVNKPTAKKPTVSKAAAKKPTVRKATAIPRTRSRSDSLSEKRQRTPRPARCRHAAPSRTLD